MMITHNCKIFVLSTLKTCDILSSPFSFQRTIAGYSFQYFWHEKRCKHCCLHLHFIPYAIFIKAACFRAPFCIHAISFDNSCQLVLSLLFLRQLLYADLQPEPMPSNPLPCQVMDLIFLTAPESPPPVFLQLCPYQQMFFQLVLQKSGFWYFALQCSFR